MKKECYICGEELEVDGKCTKVVCGDCLLVGSPLYRKDGIEYYSKEAFSRLLGEYKLEPEIWEDAQQMRNDGLSIRKIAERLRTPKTTIARHTVPQG